MANIIQYSHDDIKRLMQHHLAIKFICETRSVSKQGISGIVDGQKFAVVPVVESKNKNIIEKILKSNTQDDIATVFIFPKSGEYYSGNYLKDNGSIQFSEKNRRSSYHKSVNLTTVEQYLADNFGNPLYYFNPNKKEIDTMKFKRFPEWIAAQEEHVPFVNSLDEEIIELAKTLKEEHGKGYTAHMQGFKKFRYIQLRRIDQWREQHREKMIESTLGKYGFTLVPYKEHGLLVARLVEPTNPEQLDLF